mmetsp:Transcript_16121/g.32670  ORF Transcript_16121/g.32670 Transcript_16121/m.32670 type:complete len:249 (+) Transcript_16121:222-968(+)
MLHDSSENDSNVLAGAQVFLGVRVKEVGHPVDCNDNLDSLSKFPPRLKFAETLTVSLAEGAGGSGGTTDPRVFEDLWDGDTLCRVHGEHPPDELLSLRSDILPVFLGEVVAPALDLLVQLLCFLVIEWREATEKNVENDSQTPDINSFVVLLLLQNLGGNVSRGSAGCSHHAVALSLLELCKTEICDLDWRLLGLVRVDEVFRFEVTMNNSNFVKVGQGSGNAINEYGSFLFGITPLGDNSVEELPTR